MSTKLLEELASEDFAVRLAFVSTGSALRACLQKTSEVAAVRDELRQGAISEQTIRQFVSRLMEDFRRGEHFVHENALAALCVVLERRFTDFAEEFLHDLARLQLAEMSLCIRVARESLKRRVDMVRDRAKRLNMFEENQGGRDYLVLSEKSFSHSVAGLSRATVECGG